MEKKYDIFISSKDSDYPKAEEVYTFLTEKGYSVFFFPKCGLVDPDYTGLITEALFTCKNYIVFSSKSEYFESAWIKYGWDTFL